MVYIYIGRLVCDRVVLGSMLNRIDRSCGLHRWHSLRRSLADVYWSQYRVITGGRLLTTSALERN